MLAAIVTATVGLIGVGSNQLRMTPYAQSAKTFVARPTYPVARQHEMLELAVDAAGTFNNPFDPDEVTLDLQIEAPRKKFDVPGFWSADFDRSLEGTKESLRRSGAAGWKVRWMPTEPGTHRVRLKFRDQNDTFTTPWETISVISTEEPGVIRVSPEDSRFFQRTTGQPFFPVGANLCWGGDAGTYAYDRWLPSYGANGANFGRLWLSPAWTTFALEQPGKPQDGKGVGVFDLGNAWRIDYVLNLAAKHGIQLKLCVDSYNILRNRDAYNYWEQTPHNQVNGGPLRIWTDFWTDGKMASLYRAKLRYLIARYGSYPNLFAWEFWNEVDLTGNFDERTVGKWHQDMARYLKATDPYRRLITTSFSNSAGVREIDALPEIDFIQTHHYNSPDLVATVINQQVRKANFGKPHYIGEIGADAGGPRGEEDPTGLQIHDPMWASVVTGGAGAAMPWWWDNYIEPKNLYPLFAAVRKFTDGIDWPKEEFKVARPTVSFAVKPKKPPLRDLELSGPEAWNDAPYNRPQVIRISATGAVKGDLPVSGLLHGTRNHPNWHNPVAFETNFKEPKTLEILVRGVSGYGGGDLEVWRNGKRLAGKSYPMPDNAEEGQTTGKYNTTLAVSIPAGQQSTVIRNPGKDWIRIGYRFRNVVPAKTPNLEAWSSVGKTKAILWMRPLGRNWSAVIEQKRKVPSAPATKLTVSGLAGGVWDCQYWDTWTGKVLKSVPVTVPANGSVQLDVPAVGTDLAIRLNRR